MAWRDPTNPARYPLSFERGGYTPLADAVFELSCSDPDTLCPFFWQQAFAVVGNTVVFEIPGAGIAGGVTALAFAKTAFLLYFRSFQA